MTFHIGQKVVCVALSSLWSLPGECDAVVGNVYTIRKVRFFSFDDSWGVYLDEIVNPAVFCTAGLIERGMWTWRFRPITERKTDISIFESMLTPKPKVTA